MISFVNVKCYLSHDQRILGDFTIVKHALNYVICRASFKSAVSRGNSWTSGAGSFYACEDRDLDNSEVRAGLVNEGYQVYHVSSMAGNFAEILYHCMTLND